MDAFDSQETAGRAQEAADTPGGWAPVTHWSIVLKARDSRSPAAAEALEQLCRIYWYPLYAYIRRRGYKPEQAEDLTQDFFVHLLHQGALGSVDQAKGRFRSFLLVALKNFLVNEWNHARRQKRGGGKPLLSLDEGSAESRYRADLLTCLLPDRMFDRRWSLTLLERTMRRLEEEENRSGKGVQFARLSAFLSGDPPAKTYAQVALELGVSRDAVAMATHRLRRRFRTLLSEEIAQTVSDPGQVEDELRCLMAALRD